MFDDVKKRRQAAKWLIGIITACILIYLGVRHIDQVANALLWIARLLKPLLLGFIFALVLNVPMSAIENALFKKTKNPRLKKLKRPVAVILSLVLVFGIFVGLAFLVVPELIHAVKLISQIVVTAIDDLAKWTESADFSELIYGEELSKLNIDWLEVKKQFEQWVGTQGGVLLNNAVDTVRSLVGNLVNFFIGLVFAIYILTRKEILCAQTARLVRAWLPRKFGENLIHIASVCDRIFRQFIAGQAIEAVILGTLCMIGMVILRIPYAPMIGALVGVTALIPIVGAFVGTIVGAIMIMTQSFVKALVFVIFLLILQQIEGNLIYPKVVGAKINLPAMWVLAAVAIGGNLAGPLGMLLGVPAASAAYALIREATENREQARGVQNKNVVPEPKTPPAV
jgi:predicted PurR-regulated permease PerM